MAGARPGRLAALASAMVICLLPALAAANGQYQAKDEVTLYANKVRSYAHAPAVR